MASYNETTSSLRTKDKLLYDTTADRVLTANGKTLEDVLNQMDSNLGDHTHPASEIKQDANNRFVSDDQINKWNSGPLYTNNTPSLLAQQYGVEDTYENKTTSEMFDILLYPNIPTRISLNPSGQTRKKGITMPVDFDITVIAGTEDVTSITVNYKFVSGTESSDVIADFVCQRGQTKMYSYESSFNIEEECSIVVSANTANSSHKSKEYSFRFADPMFYGVIDINTELTADLVSDMSSAPVSLINGYSYKYNCDQQRMVFAYPAEYGELKSIYDNNGLNVTNTFEKSTISIAIESEEIDYFVYVNNASIVSDFKMTFNI